jgi:hypothetical protein
LEIGETDSQVQTGGMGWRRLVMYLILSLALLLVLATLPHPW